MKALKLSPRRISRSLVTILVLTLIQVIGAPIFAPNSSTNSASATNASLIAGYSIDANATSASDVTSSMTLVGSPAYTNTASSAGVGFYTFDATSTKYGYVTTNFPTATQNVSIFMWVYLTAEGTILSHSGQTDPYSGYRLSMMEFTGGKFRVGLYTATGAQYISSNSVSPLQNWYYVGLTYDGTTLRGYLNGDEFTETKNLTWNPAGRNAGYLYDYIHVGTLQGGTCFVSCPTAAASFRMAEFTLYLSQLSASQVNTNFLNTQSRFAPQATNPTSASILSNRTATFTTTCSRVTSANAATSCGIQWQEWSTTNSLWEDIVGATNATYTTPIMTSAVTGKKYRARVYDPGSGSPTTAKLYSVSEEAALTITQPPGSETDTALSLNGSTQYAEVSDSTGSPFDITGAITMEAWVKPADTCSGSGAVISKNVSYMMYCQSGKWMYMLLANGTSGSGAATTIDVEANVWHHLAYSKSAANGNLLVYYDGVLVQTIASGVTTMTPNDNVFRIGQYTGTAYYFNGQIDEVHIYNVQRTQAQIQTDMNNYGPINDAALVAYYDFNEGFGSTLYNREIGATSATDLTIYGAPSWPDIKSVDTTTLSAYTIVTFPRSYINSLGGWKVPAGVSKTSVLTIAGGGAGGSRVGGGGGAGGYVYRGAVTLNPAGIETITVGVGGLGKANYSGGDGTNSVFGTRMIAIGGGGGGVSNSYGGRAGRAGGSGGGTGDTSGIGATTQTTSGSSDGLGNSGAVGQGTGNWSAGGGGGAGSAGYSGVHLTKPGFGGDGQLDPIGGSNLCLAAGGGGGIYGTLAGGTRSNPGACASGTTTSGSGSSGQKVGFNATANSGSGGGGAGYYYAAENSDVAGGNGGSGVIMVRWITATKPIFTQPTNDTTTAGLSDTITVSANPISPLTRNYLWQYSTDTGTTWANISTGSGFTSQTYTTPVLETTTSGIRYQYRVIVTDSDTAGLFIVDTSTAVYEIINPRIQISGSYTVQKYGATHTDTFTVVSSTGTGNKTFAVSPNNRSGITWNMGTANQATLTIAGSLGPGTYYDTMTATDTKGAQTQLSVAIVVNKADTITVTAITRSDTYTGLALNFTPAFTVSGLINSDTITSASMNWNYSGTENSSTPYPLQSTKPINAGSYTITPVPPASISDSYTAVSVVTAPLTIYRATRIASETISATTVKYGSTLTLTSSVSPGSGFGSTTYATSTSDSCTVFGSTVTAIKSSGTCSFTATISQTANFETATSTAKTATLSKADTITVQIRNPVTTVYSPTGPTTLPTLAISGLVLSDTATTSRLYSAPASGLTCATGGACALGDTGPGGGIVFYDAGSNQSWGRYLEAAPANWVGAGQTDSATVNVTKWCVASPSIDATTIGNLPDGIGQGYANTYSSSLNCTGGAIYRAKSYRGGGKSDWYVPTGAELAVMATPTNRTRLSLVDLFSTGNYWGYWGSNENSDGTIGSLVTQAWQIGATNKNELTHNYMRPIRAFFGGGQFVYNAVTNSSTIPVDVETWTVSASPLTFSVGSSSDYQNIVYETSTLTITQASQTKLGINLYGAVAGSSFTLQISGGSGSGAVTQTIIAGGTGTNCAVSNGVLSNSNSATDQKTCNISVVKAAERNYKVESLTATIYFMAYVNNQSSQVGSGSTIGINGVTSFTVDTTTPPAISTLSATAISIAGGGSFTINGTGFTGTIIVKFYRNKAVIPASTSSTTLTFNVSSIGAAGATSGRITVITDNGQAVSTDTLVINP